MKSKVKSLNQLTTKFESLLSLLIYFRANKNKTKKNYGLLMIKEIIGRFDYYSFYTNVSI